MIDKGTGADGAYTATGATFTTGGTVTVDSTLHGDGTECFDGDTATYWESNGGGAGHFIKYDLGSGITKTARQLRIFNSGATGGPSNNGIAGFKFQGSPDNVSWYDLIVDTCPAAAQWYDFYCPSNVTAYRYYRVYSTGSYHVDAIIIKELEFIGDVLPSGTYNFTSLTVNSGVDLIAIKPVTIKCQGTVTVNGGLHCGGVLNINSDVLTIGASGIVSGNLTVWNYTLNNSGIITGDPLVATGTPEVIVHSAGAISAAYDVTLTFKTPSDIVKITTTGRVGVNSDSAYLYLYCGGATVLAYSISGHTNYEWSNSVDSTGWSNATYARIQQGGGNRISGSWVAGIWQDPNGSGYPYGLTNFLMGIPRINKAIGGLPLHYLHR